MTTIDIDTDLEASPYLLTIPGNETAQEIWGSREEAMTLARTYPAAILYERTERSFKPILERIEVEIRTDKAEQGTPAAIGQSLYAYLLARSDVNSVSLENTYTRSASSLTVYTDDGHAFDVRVTAYAPTEATAAQPHLWG